MKYIAPWMLKLSDFRRRLAFHTLSYFKDRKPHLRRRFTPQEVHHGNLTPTYRKDWSKSDIGDSIAGVRGQGDNRFVRILKREI